MADNGCIDDAENQNKTIINNNKCIANDNGKNNENGINSNKIIINNKECIANGDSNQNNMDSDKLSKKIKILTNITKLKNK